VKSCRASSLRSWIARCLSQSGRNHSPGGPTAPLCAPKWKPRYTSPPFGKWRVRAKGIAKVSDPLSTIRKFTELRSEMEYLARAVDDAHEEFWGWVQQQEDAAQDARGR